MEELEGFKFHLTSLGYKPRTIKNHLGSLYRLLKHAPNLTLQEVQMFIVSLREKGLGIAYVNHHIIALRIYAEYKGIDAYRNDLKLQKRPEAVKATMSDREIEDFLSLPPSPRSRMEIYERWTLFFKILAYSGMRPGEVASLTIEAIDFGRNVFVLYDTKTNVPRYVPIAHTLLDDLTVYLKTLHNKHLFLSKKEGKGVVRSEDWMTAFNKRIRQLGIVRRNLTAHSLRHSFITRMLEEDVNLFKIQKIVGHKKPETTLVYTHYTTKDIVKTLRKDPLSRANLPLYERKKMFRELAFKLLEDYATTADEEKELIDSLKIYA